MLIFYLYKFKYQLRNSNKWPLNDQIESHTIFIRMLSNFAESNFGAICKLFLHILSLKYYFYLSITLKE